MTATDHLADFSTTDDALVLASVSSKAESDLLDDWLRAQRKAHPDTRVEVLRLPHEDAPPQLIEHLANELEAGEDRTVVPVRVFWVPGGLPTRVKLVGLISGRDTYRPPEKLQRAILRKDPSRARIVAGEPATVSELRQQWRENTVGETREDFAKFVLRRASLDTEHMGRRCRRPGRCPRGQRDGEPAMGDGELRVGAAVRDRGAHLLGRRCGLARLGALGPLTGRPGRLDSRARL